MPRYIVKHFPCLVPFFDLLYSQKNQCHYRKDDDSSGVREQEEGFAQGFPLSGAFAVLVLLDILQELDRKLWDRTKL